MISVFFAVSGRPKMFQRALHSLKETTFGYDVETIAVIDDDLASANIAEHYGVDMIDYSRERRGALNAWNKALSHTDGSILVPAGDDQIFHKGWLKYAVESFQDKLNNYGVLGMNDLAYDGNLQLATMFMFSRDYCKEHMGGVFAPPCYHYYCVDSEWNQKAKDLGMFYWEPKSIIEHVHSAHGKRPVDDTDRLKDAGWMEEDNRIFEHRKLEGFPVTWQPIV